MITTYVLGGSGRAMRGDVDVVVCTVDGRGNESNETYYLRTIIALMGDFVRWFDCDLGRCSS